MFIMFLSVCAKLFLPNICGIKLQRMGAYCSGLSGKGEGGWRGGNRGGGGGEERGVGTGLTGSIDSYVFIMT